MDAEGSVERHAIDTVWDSIDGVVQNYKTYLIENQAGEFVETVAVCEIDGKLLVAVPFGVWHRSVSKRLLYSISYKSTGG